MTFILPRSLHISPLNQELNDLYSKPHSILLYAAPISHWQILTQELPKRMNDHGVRTFSKDVIDLNLFNSTDRDYKIDAYTVQGTPCPCASLSGLTETMNEAGTHERK